MSLDRRLAALEQSAGTALNVAEELDARRAAFKADVARYGFADARRRQHARYSDRRRDFLAECAAMEEAGEPLNQLRQRLRQAYERVPELDGEP